MTIADNFKTDTTDTTLKSQLRQFIASELLAGRAAALGDDDELLLSGLVDSLGAVRLIAFIEMDLGISIPAEDVIIENFQTVNAMAAYLAERKNF